MSLRKRLKKHDESGVDMTPMLDIVFIMLIFFIVTATFLDETGLDFTQADTANSPPCDGCPPAIKVFVDAGNNVSVNGTGIDVSSVQFAVESRLATTPKANVVLTAHYRADLDPIVQIKDDMEALGRKMTLKVIKD